MTFQTEFHSPFIADSFHHLLIGPDTDIRHPRTCTDLVYNSDCIPRSSDVDIGFRELQYDIRVADKRPVSRTAQTVDKIVRLVVRILLEHEHIAVGADIIVTVVIALYKERPPQLLADLYLSAIVSGILECIIRFVWSQHDIFQTWIPVGISSAHSVFIAIRQIVAVEFIETTQKTYDTVDPLLDNTCLVPVPVVLDDSAIGIEMDSVPEEEHLPCSRIVDKYLIFPFRDDIHPMKDRPVSILEIVHEIRRRPGIGPAVPGVTSTDYQLEIVTVAGICIILKREDHLVILFVGIVEEINELACPQSIAAVIDHLEVIHRLLIIIGSIIFGLRTFLRFVSQPHIGHSTERIGCSLGRTAIIFRKGIHRTIRAVDTIIQIRYDSIPDLDRSRLAPGALILRNHFKIERHPAIYLVQTGIGPRPEETRLAYITLKFFRAQACLVKVGKSIIDTVDGSIAPLPFIPHHKFRCVFCSIRQSPQMVIVRYKITLELHSHPALSVETCHIFVPQLDPGQVIPVEILIQACHSLVCKTFRRPHICTRNLIGRSYIQHIRACCKREKGKGGNQNSVIFHLYFLHQLECNLCSY